MRPFFFLLLFPAQLFAQVDSPEDEILQKIELGDPAWHPENEFLRRPSVPLSRLDRKGDCFYLDSLYTGVILEPVYDSLYYLLGCDKGYLTGEKMIRQRFHRDSAFCIVYYSEAAPSDSVLTVHFTSYYPNGKVKSTGMDWKQAYPRYESIFGGDEPDGTFFHYYENGETKSVYTRCERGYDGRYTEFHPNGKPKEVRCYKLGQPVGKWLQYAESGKRTGKMTFKFGRGSGRWNGEKVSKSEF